MKKEVNFQKSPFPLPLIVVGAGTLERPNASLYIWFSQFNEEPPTFAVGIKKKRYTYTLIKESGEFSVNIPRVDILDKVDSLGVTTGREINKFEAFGFTAFKGKFIKAPLIKECPVNIELKVIKEIDFSDHVMIIGEVLNTWIEDKILKDEGILDIKKLNPVIVNYSDLSYYKLGDFLNFAGFSRRK